MNARIESVLYGILIVALSGLVLSEGRRNMDLRAAQALESKDLYRKISRSQVKLQILDVRRDPSSDFEDSHIPGSIPFPECDAGKIDMKVLERIFPYAPTVIVSRDGDAELFRKCRLQFASAVNLSGGMEGWLDAGLPEDSGEYVPPKNSAGGGCL